MFSKYKPTWMVNAIYEITPAQLKQLGIKAILTDLDNTLIAWDNLDGTEELLAWINEMKEAEMPILVISNNTSSRVKRVVENLSLDYVARALKPTTHGFKVAQKKLNMKPKELVMVGDQIMTDIRGANAAGIRSILVQPIVNTDNWNTKINRFFERKIMNYLTKKDPDMIWKGGLK
ncbi:YqeG family HAD IIIA-type phosphatase [Melissococcus plutonius]|uniref:YqeG family HAD IIIA-type phosphatase n=1 Tax=Melissococcus plutonius TaxID=33970 RepID=UPI00065E0812|nr:YqeG family HAD IIIA-type phosphatase [Melissococcus plutonius]KMT32806.1 hydrolase, HAD subfamily IIIA [Melissococcus plutonius]KMT34465.1 hydrolase, HAD subfamily IIIA [Melissococcus plutonius]BBD14884.1 hydrolase, HAD subfamily IIIA [Melissococcus plutonius]